MNTMTALSIGFAIGYLVGSAFVYLLTKKQKEQNP